MTPVPEAYYQFIMDYAPYVYAVPEAGPDPEWGKAAFAAAFAVDFLYEAYFEAQFEDRTAEIESKIVDLANWILTQQCTDSNKLAHGGFKSNENSPQYYTVDACRTIPALLKACELTSNTDYLNSAKLAATTFLCNMQHKPSQLSVHDKYYGGFARAVTLTDTWLQQMDIESLYSLIGLKMLCESDPTNKTTYETIIADAISFYRPGLEQLYLYYDPLPNGDAVWHRTGTSENTIFDDSFAYALLGLCAYEGWSTTVQKTYNFLNAIAASPQYPAYNPAICWAGYLDVTGRVPACDYYDAVASGILAQIRKDHDKVSYAFSAEIIGKYQGNFMFWGAKHADYGYVENKQAMATVCWLAQLFLNYEEPVTRFTQILKSKGENVALHPIKATGERATYGEGLDIKAIVSPARAEEILLEPGYIINDYLTINLFTPLRCHDKIRRKGQDYEVLNIQEFVFQGETAFRKALCRRLIGQ